MEEPSSLVRVAEYASLGTGQIDALMAAVVGLLRATRNIPEVSESVLHALAEAYPSDGSRSENRFLVAGFEGARDELLKALRRE